MLKSYSQTVGVVSDWNLPPIVIVYKYVRYNAGSGENHLEQFEDTKGMIRSRNSKDWQCNGQKTNQRYTKHYTENTNPTNLSFMAWRISAINHQFIWMSIFKDCFRFDGNKKGKFAIFTFLKLLFLQILWNFLKHRLQCQKALFVEDISIIDRLWSLFLIENESNSNDHWQCNHPQHE